MKLDNTIWRRFRRDRSGVVALEFALLIPTFLSLFFCCLQIIYVMLNQVLLNAAIEGVISQHAVMYMKNTGKFTTQEHKELICNKMLTTYNSCDKKINVQLYSYANKDLKNIKSLHSNSWKKVDKYYISFLRVDYEVPLFVPFLKRFMPNGSEFFNVSSLIIVTPSIIRTGDS